MSDNYEQKSSTVSSKDIKLNYIKTLETGYADIGRQRDSLQIAIASGALAISVTLVTKTTGIKLPCFAFFVLFFSWITLCASLICSLYAFGKALEAYKAERNILIAELNGSSSDQYEDNRKSALEKLESLNYCATTLLLIGIACLLIFAGMFAIYQNSASLAN